MKSKNESNLQMMNLLRNPIITIIFGIIICLLFPIAIKALVIKPTLTLLGFNNIVSKTIQFSLTAIIILFTYYIFFKKYENRKITELSLKKMISDCLKGFILGFLLISIVIGIYYIFGLYTPVSIGEFSTLLDTLLIFLVTVTMEEIIFRGIIYRITEKRLGTIWALVISSLLFGLVHFGNSGFSVLSGFAIALELGLLCGITYTLTKRLWIPITIHIGWNISLIFWGTTVSGISEFPNYMDATLTGHEIITGGKFGPENSIITILLSLILFGFIYSYLSKNNLIIKARNNLRIRRKQNM